MTGRGLVVAVALLVAAGARAGEDGPARLTVRIEKDGDALRWFVDGEAVEGIEAVRRRLAARKGEDLQPTIEAGHEVPNEAVVSTLDAFHEAGFEKIDFYGSDAGGSKRLADEWPDDTGARRAAGGVDFTVQGDWPVAASGTTYEVDGHGPEFALTDRGHLCDTNGPVSLDLLARKLALLEAKRALLRVDRDAPWRHVQWVLAVLKERGIEDVGFAVADEFGQWGVLPARLVPSIRTQVPVLHGKPAADGALDLDGEALEAEAFRARVVRAAIDRYGALTAAVRAAPDARFEDVARTIDAFRTACVTYVHLPDLPEVTKETRTAERLPKVKSKTED